MKALNVTVRSEGALDTNKTPSTSGLAYIEVNGKNYATQTKGFNVAAFDALSGRNELYLKLSKRMASIGNLMGTHFFRISFKAEK